MGAQLDAAVLDAQLEALLEATPAARAQQLQALSQCAPEIALLLQKMLRMAEDAGTDNLRQLARVARDEDSAPPVIPGLCIGELIGRGGMASVYAATRDVHGVAEAVAVKVLRAASVSEVERWRFVNEQRILAKLKHPNIATLLDVGVVDERAYMVLERIDGVPIDERISAERSGVDAVLAAIVQVAGALQLAHEHLVIHRDIKPDNVLVDAHGQIKLIDFGIAKYIDNDDRRAESTRTGMAPLTLRYASPEQLLGQPVGMASDVYQLGLLMYRLLCNAWPHDDDMAELPAMRMRADAATELASRRVADPRTRRRLQGDLDSILLRCLRFDPGQRYRSVAELVDDINRHLQHQPVRARQQSRGYLLRSFVYRHRLGVAIAGAVVLLMILGTATAIYAAAQAREYADRSAQVLDTLTGVLSAADPFSENAGGTEIGVVLDRAERELLTSPGDDAEFQVQLLLRLAKIRSSLRQSAKAQALLDQASAVHARAPVSQPLSQQLLLARASSLIDLGRTREAELELEQSGVLALRSGDSYVEAIIQQARIRSAQGDRAAAERLLSKLFAETPPGAVNPELLMGAYNSHALLLEALGDRPAARRAYQQAESILQGLPNATEARIQLLMNQAILSAVEADYAQASVQYETAIALAHERVGSDHPFYSVLLNNHASLLLRMRHYERAYRELDSVYAVGSTLENPKSRDGFLDGHAVAALLSGHAQAALHSSIERLEALAALDPAARAAVAPGYPQQAAWVLFELGEYELAAAFAERADWAQPRADVARVVALITAEMSGRTIALEPADIQSECQRLLHGLLRAAFLAAPRPAGDRMPTDCSVQTAARLQAMGVPPAVDLDPDVATRVPDQSPLVRRVLGEAVEPVVTEHERERLRALLVKLSTDPSARL